MRHPNLLWHSTHFSSFFLFIIFFSLCFARDKNKRFVLEIFDVSAETTTLHAFRDFVPLYIFLLSFLSVLSALFFFLSTGYIPFVEGITSNANEISAIFTTNIPVIFKEFVSWTVDVLMHMNIREHASTSAMSVHIYSWLYVDVNSCTRAKGRK